MRSVTERFLEYVAMDTQSCEDVEAVPSTQKQWRLAERLVEELKQMGAMDVHTGEHCYVYATIPATCKEKVPVIGFIAHMDTATAMSGRDVKARVVSYHGGDIVLNEELHIVMRAEQFPALVDEIGKDLIVTDGTTLLGADDKAGIAEIMTMAEYLLSNPQISHGEIKIGFTPDEEVGRGVDFFDVQGFGADGAYTVDGGAVGELEYENFNAAGAKVKIHGTSIHPGSAKGQMKNALLIGMELEGMLPQEQKPAYTEGYEGFFHLDGMEGSVEEAGMVYIIRDHDRAKFEQKKQLFTRVVDFLNAKYGEGTVALSLKDSYYNMKEKLADHMELVENAKAAMEKLGIVPLVHPIRGGTDGAGLSYMGLPCPNLCTGGYNCHGKFEYISVQDMEKVVELLVCLACNVKK
ncbi:MAG: peptidase T [Lachnospiraceae bacterium]|nr:peptidase T [Lachnospiraceae bacterium]